MDEPIWRPSAERMHAATLTAFLDYIRRHALASGDTAALYPDAEQVGDYLSLYAWSIAHPEQFWPAVWRFSGVVADGHDRPWDEVVRGLDQMQPSAPAAGPHWFTGARLNFAENLLRLSGDPARAGQAALVWWNEEGRQQVLSFAELAEAVSRLSAALRRCGVRAGDRVAGYLPNLPQAVIAMLASASLGALWSSTAPDFGAAAVLDRFRQIAPKVLFCADRYLYAGEYHHCLDTVRAVARAIESIEQIVVVPYAGGEPFLAGLSRAQSWDDFILAGPCEPSYSRLPFDHPLYIMFSSGTTGLPKCIVHGAGGTLLQHVKELTLHSDVQPGDRVFYYTTCGWMMWNWLVSALAAGATVVLYDGHPLKPRPAILWELAEQERLTHFGTSAKYLARLEQEGVAPGQQSALKHLRVILSTGSPLKPESYDYVYQRIKSDVQLASISGGTDIISCFALGNPLLPVYRGELQSLGLGMAVQVFDEAGQAVAGQPGELVCTKPFPSMPVAFWNDPDGVLYRGAYFEHYPGVWRHGDWAELTPAGGLIIYGRSDATLNPGGVRIGTAEIYRQAESLPEVEECLAVGQEWRGDTRVVLFVRLRDGHTLDEPLRERIRAVIRKGASPHHVPRVIVPVPDLPRTLNGKLSELAVRETIHGRPVRNLDALANPEALLAFRDRPELAG